MPRADTTLSRLAGLSAAATVALAAALAWMRSGIGSPFEVRVFQHLALYHDFQAIAPYLAILGLALLASFRDAGLRAAGWCHRNVAWVAAATAILLALGTHLVYHAHALSLDEQLALFQSRVFAQGRLAGAYPPALLEWLVPADLRGKFFVVAADGRVASAYWPGFSLLLVPFTMLGVPWLLNPLIGAATVLVVHRIAFKLIQDQESAGLAVLLTLGSQAVTVNALSLYAMPAHLLLNGIFALLLLAPTPARAFAAGLVGSFALVLHNPVPHLLFCLPWIAWLAWRAGRWKLLAALGAGYLPLSVVLGWGWALYLASLESGQPPSLLNPIQVLTLRLGSAAGWAHGSILEMRTIEFAKLWLWACPALIVAAVLGAFTARHETAWKVLIGAGVLTYAGYFLVPFTQGHGWGYRYFLSAWLVLPLLGAAFCRARPAVAGYLAACALLSLVLLTGLRTLQVEQFVARHMAQNPARNPGEAQFVFIHLRGGYYIWDLVQNDPFLRNRPVMLYSRDPAADSALMAARFPEQRLLHYDPRGSVWGR